MFIRYISLNDNTYFELRFFSSFLLILLLFWAGGCAGREKSDTQPVSKSQLDLKGIDENIGEVEIDEFFLSPGDEIEISVFKHDDLNKKITIPPGGKFYYPIVGEIDASGKSLKQLREIITKGLSEYKEHLLIPGDEVSISIFSHDELNRRITIPPDGYIFFPLAGEINANNKTLRELRKIIANSLMEYKNSNLIPGDELQITVYKQEDLNRRLIIPPDGYFFFPLVGEISASGKTPRELRKIITKGLSNSIPDAQVSVDLVSSVVPKIVVDPQVAVDIVKLSNLKRVVDPEVSIEVVKFGGHKVFVLGEVKNPGVYLTDGNMSLVEAILAASGPTLDAKQKNVLLIRGGIDQPKPELIVVNLEKALIEGDVTQNIAVYQGDIIYIPRTFISNVDRFFVHLSTIISPFLQLETGYFIGQRISNNDGAGASVSP